MGAIPEGIYIAWNLSASEITDRAKKLIEKSRAVYDEVGLLTVSDMDVNNVLMVRFSLQFNSFTVELPII